MRRSETKERRFIARKMMAGTAMGAEVLASRRSTADRPDGARSSCGVGCPSSASSPFVDAAVRRRWSRKTM